MDLDQVVDELYAVPPEEFVALRQARQDEARADGDRELAKEIGSLPKPSAAAWVCNLLVRARREEIEALVELGDLLREAQENLTGDQLRALNAQRSQLLSALTRQASALARQHGRPVGSAVAGQVEESLRAAMADREAGEAMLSGRLTSSMSYSGMGTGGRPDLRLVRPPASERPRQERSTPRGVDPGERRRAQEEEARRAAEERRPQERAEARRALEEATERAEEALAAAEKERARVEELDTRRADLQARAAELADELTRAEREATEAAADLQRAERRRRTADRQAAEAAAVREHALARVAELPGED